MPISDGYEACRRIRSIYANTFGSMTEGRDSIGFKRQDDDKKLGVKPILIAASALVNDEVIEKTHIAGFDALYEVPLQADQIENQIKPLINKRQTQNLKKEQIKKKLAENYENQFHDIHKAIEIR